jgi:hypothetical protein
VALHGLAAEPRITHPLVEALHELVLAHGRQRGEVDRAAGVHPGEALSVEGRALHGVADELGQALGLMGGELLRRPGVAGAQVAFARQGRERVGDALAVRSGGHASTSRMWS